MDFASTCDSADRVSVAQRVLTEIARAEGVERSELLPPLYEAVDPDALDRLVRNSDPPVTVRFAYGDWTVEVRRDDDLEIAIESDVE